MSSDLVIKILSSYRKCKSTELWLALVMGAMAQEDGTQICDKVASFAKRLRVSHRTIQYRLRRMEKDVFLIKTNAGDGRNGQPTRYRISPQWIDSTPSIDDIFAHVANAAQTDIADPGATVGARSRKRVGAKMNAGVGANSANCSKNEHDSLHPQYIDFSLYKLTEEGYKTLAPARRLSPDWRLPNRFGQWALETFPGWNRELILQFAEKFREYWTRTGCAKTDWFDTWRRFCQQEAYYLARNPQRHVLTVSPAPTAAAPALPRPLLPHPGESEESYRRRKQAAADVPIVGHDVPPLQHATEVPRAEPGESRTPESKARIKAELMRALQAAKQGEACLAERSTASTLTTQTQRVSARPAPADSCATEDAAVTDGPRSRAAKPVEALPGAIACAPAVTADAVATLPSKSAASPCVRPSGRSSGRPGGNRKSNAPLAPVKRRTMSALARASPLRRRVRSDLRFGQDKGLVPPTRGSQAYPSVRLRYLLPDATVQWR